MHAGRLKKKITVYKKVKTISEYGDEKYELRKMCDTRAGVSYASGSRNVTNDELQFPESVTFYIRWYVDVEEEDVIEYNGKKYFIVNIPFNEERQEKTIYATEINE